jgi:hypothetical protein
LEHRSRFIRQETTASHQLLIARPARIQGEFQPTGVRAAIQSRAFQHATVPVKPPGFQRFAAHVTIPSPVGAMDHSDCDNFVTRSPFNRVAALG